MDTFQIASIPLKAAVYIFQVTHPVVVGLVGGWVGGIQVYIYAILWPNLQERTCKHSSQVEFQVGPEYGNNYIQDTVIIPISVCVMVAPRNISFHILKLQ